MVMPLGRRTPLAVRFERFTLRATNGCLEWTGSVNRTGYGSIKVNGTTRTATRVRWELVNGPIPAGLGVCHHCDNRRCVELTHLFLGTRKQNLEDMVAKGRSARGEKQGISKLTIADVIYLRSLKKKEFHRHTEAARLGVRPETLDRVRRGVDWAHI